MVTQNDFELLISLVVFEKAPLHNGTILRLSHLLLLYCEKTVRVWLLNWRKTCIDDLCRFETTGFIHAKLS